MTLTKHFYKPRASEGELYVEDFVDMDPVTGALRPWKCEASLRVFRVKVSGIPFQAPSFYQDQEQKQEEIQDQEHDLQRRVFQRLSRFQRLEDLALGHFHENYTPIDGSQVNADDNTTYYDQPYGQTGWDFSLHSGLGLLGGLKEMRRFSKKMTPPSTVGVDEVKWMVSQWPKLESIRGLVASPEKEETDVDEDVAEAQGKDDGQVVKWLEKHCPWIWVDRCDFWSNF
ncbi:hypothetical protein BGW39_001617 [Mortierella sp. 14UC]|nr:hypothetical protein BGW39_001617 [Mortierella sp. 14UC]